VSSPVFVIDLFAGPGGLAEGFSAYRDSKGRRPFRIRLSVEKEASAHATLGLRAFIRQFGEDLPHAYYDYVKGKIGRESLYSNFPEQAVAARIETLEQPRTLGEPDDDAVIRQYLLDLRRKDGAKVVIGGPPCQAYSLVGRARNKGIQGYRAEKDTRHYLYQEYLKVLELVEPEVFVMENVKGILSSSVGGRQIFPRLLDDLRNPAAALGKRRTRKYEIYSLVSTDDFFGGAGSDYLIRCENFGIPQSRHRVILLGVREDLRVAPGTIAPSPIVAAREVLADFQPLRSGLSKGDDSDSAWRQTMESVIAEVSRIGRDHGLAGVDFDAIQAESRKMKGRGGQFVRSRRKFRGPLELRDWYLDPNLRGFLNHETRGHIRNDLARYLYCAAYARANDGNSPQARDFPPELAPHHRNWGSGNFADRFKVQAAGRPSSTITSHISKDGHYFIHYEPAQCRSLTVREAARLQTFPDNYFFEGNRTQQYVQVGNAVPPYLARQIAAIVHGLL